MSHDFYLEGMPHVLLSTAHSPEGKWNGFEVPVPTDEELSTYISELKEAGYEDWAGVSNVLKFYYVKLVDGSDTRHGDEPISGVRGLMWVKAS